jgi:hypothetical protein
MSEITGSCVTSSGEKDIIRRLTIMSNHDFYTLWSAALAAADQEMYVAEWSTSSIWGEPEDLTDDDLLRIADYCGKLWDSAHMPVREIKEASGMSQLKFAERFCIPRRTVEDWCAGKRECPDYLRLLIMEALGIVSRTL